MNKTEKNNNDKPRKPKNQLRDAAVRINEHRDMKAKAAQEGVPMYVLSTRAFREFLDKNK